jgi:hypothetical protein
MDWPANSPDLNLIEHAWDILQCRISNRQNQPNSLQELADALVDEWSRISQVEFQTLIRIVSDAIEVCRTIIANVTPNHNGAPTESIMFSHTTVLKSFILLGCHQPLRWIESSVQHQEFGFLHRRLETDFMHLVCMLENLLYDLH